MWGLEVDKPLQVVDNQINGTSGRLIKVSNSVIRRKKKPRLVPDPGQRVELLGAAALHTVGSGPSLALSPPTLARL